MSIKRTKLSHNETEVNSDCESFSSGRSFLFNNDENNSNLSFDERSQHGQIDTYSEVHEENDDNDPKIWPVKLSPTLQAIEWQRQKVEKECIELKRLQRVHVEFLEKERLEKEHTKFEQMLWDDCTLAMKEEEEHLKKLREERKLQESLVKDTQIK
jgi:hypothetical protein